MNHILGPPLPNNQGLTPMQLSSFHPLPHSYDGHLMLVCPLSTSYLLFNCAYCVQVTTQIPAVPSTPQLAAVPHLPCCSLAAYTVPQLHLLCPLCPGLFSYCH